MLLKEFNHRLKELLLDYLWRQWIQLGVQASHSLEKRDEWIIDPEALWLLTASVGREDARLFDLSIDWLAENAPFINLPRLKSLQRQYDFESSQVVAAMAATVQQQNKRLNWTLFKTESQAPPSPLFSQGTISDIDPETIPTDPIFLKFGLLRGPFQARNLARRFNYTMRECALLRLRALVGLNARAEIYAFLCTHPNGHPSGIARETGYSQKNIQDTITDMSAAHIVFSSQLIGRKKIYLINKNDWKTLLHNTEAPPNWITWPPLLRALEILFLRCKELETADTSPLFLSGKLRELANQLRPLLEREEQSIVLPSCDDLSGTDYTLVFLENTLNLFSSQLNLHADHSSKG